MHALVVLRLIPDTAEELELSADGLDIDREWIGFKLNEFDDHALEEAILLKEAAGAKVTAVAFEGDGADKLLQMALARGADEVFKIAHDGELPVPAPSAARLIGSLVSQIKPDVILTGVQTPEDLFGQLAPALGAVLGWPQVSAVSGMKAEDGRLTIQQEYSGGISATLHVRLPAVVGIQAASKPPRYVSGTKLREVAGVKPAALEAEAQPDGSMAKKTSLAAPVSAGQVEMIEGDADAVASKLVEVLRERGLLRV